jgi:hypothetical protein
MISALVVASLSSAAEAQAAAFCNGIHGDEPTSLTLALVSGHPILLAVVPSDCRPNEHGCRTPITLAVGTLVASFQSAEGYTCIETSPERGSRRVGWIPEGDLRPDQNQTKVAPEWWVGRWIVDFNEISMSLQHGQLYGEGYAESGPHNNPRFGGFSGDGVQSGRDILFEEPERLSGCHVRIVQFGSQIAVMDNAKCGAMTRVSGFYTQSSTTPAPRGSVVGRSG